MKHIFKILFASLMIFLVSCYAYDYSISTGVVMNDELIFSDDEMINVSMSFDYPIFDSIDGLMPRTTDVLRAEVLDERVAVINIVTLDELIPPVIVFDGNRDPLYQVFTVYRLKVLDVFKGNQNIGDIIEVRIHGGRIGNINASTPSSTHLTIGDDLIFFLNSSSIKSSPFTLASMSQAVYRFSEPSQNNLVARGINIQFESLNERNQLTLTLEDLVSIAEEN